MAADNPNFLIIQTDSQDGRLLGCMKHAAMRRATPNADALARRGTIFTNAYSNNAICCPSRASTFSGQFTHHCEGWNNFKGLEPGTPTFFTRFADTGYRVDTIGKTDYVSGKHTIRARVTPWTRSANIMRPCYTEHAPVRRDEDGPKVHVNDWAKVEKAKAWLAEAAGSSEPFLLYVGLDLPHPGFTTSKHYLDMIDEAGIEIPPADREDHPSMLLQRVQKNWTHGFAEDMVRRVRHTYFAMIAEVDAMLGRILAALEANGLKSNTYVIFTSDHGEMACEHHQYYKMNLYEPAAHIPMIVAGPGVREGATIDRPVSLVDIHPTLNELAGLDRPEGLDGWSLADDLAGRPSEHPDWAFAECHDSTCNTGHFMFRRGKWKYIAYVGYRSQLFDLEADPWEVVNQVDRRPEVAAEMDRALRAVVDYEEVDARVKAYDRASFAAWREERMAAGDYEELMAKVYSGWSDSAPLRPWTAEDERLIEKWLAGSENREQVTVQGV